MSTSQLSGTGRDLMLRAMISMAAADGDVADVETATISAIFEKVTGQSVDASEIEAAASGIVADSGALKADLSAAADGLGKPDKEAVMKAAYLVLVADGQVASPERKRLFEIAHALDMPEIHVTAILEDLAE